MKQILTFALLVLSTFLLSFSVYQEAIAKESLANEALPSKDAKWSGSGPHPYLKLKYLEQEAGGCGSIFYLYYPKGVLKHAKNTPVITSAFCIIEKTLGQGIHKKDVCEVLKIDFDNGGGACFWQGGYSATACQGNLFAEGKCNKSNFKKLNPTVVDMYETVTQRINVRFHILKDQIGFRNSLTQEQIKKLSD